MHKVHIVVVSLLIGGCSGESTTDTSGDDPVPTSTTADSSEPGCEPGFYGADCVPCDCGEGGTCDDGIDGTGVCACDDGWLGERCELDCSSGTPHKDGSCTVRLVAVADAFVCSDDWADKPKGTETFTPRAVGRQNKFTGEQIGRAIYAFALPAAPEGATVTGGTLTLRMADNFAGFPTAVEVRPLDPRFDEKTVTWSTQPTALDAVLDTAQVDKCCFDTFDFDVSAAVQTFWKDGRAAMGLQLRSTDEKTIGGVRWMMRESEGETKLFGDNEGFPPTLEFTVTP